MSNQEKLLEEEYDELDDDYLYDDEEPAQYESLAETGGEVSQPSKGNAASPSSASAEKKEPYKANKNQPSNDNVTENKKTEGSKSGEQKKENPYKGKDNNSNMANKKQTSKNDKNGAKKPNPNQLGNKKKNLNNASKGPKGGANGFKGKKSLSSIASKFKSKNDSGISTPSASGGDASDAADAAVDAAKDIAKDKIKKAIMTNPYVWIAIGVVCGILLIMVLIAGGGAGGNDDDSEEIEEKYGTVNIGKYCDQIAVYYSDSETPEYYSLDEYVAKELLSISPETTIDEDSESMFEVSGTYEAAAIYLRTKTLADLKDSEDCSIRLDLKKEIKEGSLEVINQAVSNTSGIVMLQKNTNQLTLAGVEYSALTGMTQASSPYVRLDEGEKNENEEVVIKDFKGIVSNSLSINQDSFDLKVVTSIQKIATNMNYNTMCNTSSAEANIVTFIGAWEGTNGYCDNGNGYIASDKLDGVPTAGYGVSNHALSSLTSYINEKGYEQYFHVNSNGKYYMNNGDCVPVSVIDDLKYAFIEKNSLSAVEQWQKNNPDVVLAQYQKDAIGVFNYNVGSSYTNKILDDYKEKGYEGIWENISKYKYYKNKEGELIESTALKKRRKAEFALFVTGDYTDRGLFYSRSLENYEDINSEGVFEREAVCQMPDEAGLQVDVNSGYIMRISRPLRDNSIYYDQSSSEQLAYTALEGECAWYAGHRAKEILQQTGSDKIWTNMPNGGEYCYTSEVTSGRFSSSKDVNQPKQGALISWNNGKWGHVAVVEKVNDDGSITISEGAIKFGSVADRDTLHSMYDTYGVKGARKTNCEGNGSGCFNTRTIEKDKINNGFVCYIYLID